VSIDGLDEVQRGDSVDAVLESSPETSAMFHVKHMARRSKARGSPWLAW
jgi:hypothetical protein